MARDTQFSSLRAITVAMLLACVVAVPSVADAQPHRARLSRDLADRIKHRIEGATEVIICGSDSQIDALATRYGVRLKKRIHCGGVLEATGGQIDALSQDPDVH